MLFRSQGFSEPEAGSDLADLRCRARLIDGSFAVDGHKVWSSFGQDADRCLLLARTGPQESRHRGLTMMLVDYDSPGLTVRPIAAANGRNEFAEIIFDDVRVPTDRVIGTVGTGWAAAMELLQWERGMFAWQRQAALHGELTAALRGARGTLSSASLGRVGEAYRKIGRAHV